MTASLSKKLQKLDAFLSSSHLPDEAMLLTTLDGFLAGLIVCPELIMPSEWVPHIWGEDGAAVFESEVEAQAIMGLIMEHYNDIVRQLDRGRYQPIYDMDRDGSWLWEVWLEGFWQALDLRPEAWQAFSADDDPDLQLAVFILTRLRVIADTLPEDLAAEPGDTDLERQAPDFIPEAIEILHRVRKQAHTNPFARPANENQPKTGRNDPCPCGSGKKFKKCCLN